MKQYLRVIILPLVATLAYFWWESRAEGNIRVDLLLIYPALFAIYVSSLWKIMKWYSVLAAILLMGMNFYYFTQSYAWFDKAAG